MLQGKDLETTQHDQCPNLELVLSQPTTACREARFQGSDLNAFYRKLLKAKNTENHTLVGSYPGSQASQQFNRAKTVGRVFLPSDSRTGLVFSYGTFHSRGRKVLGVSFK